jgi:hypothetical protein
VWIEAMKKALQQAKQFYRTRTQWLGEGGEPSKDAHERAKACLLCPHNVKRPLEELFKGAVAEAVRQQVELKSAMKVETPLDDALHICNLCGCVLKLKVHVPLKHARDNTPDWEKFPDWCWLKTSNDESNPST